MPAFTRVFTPTAGGTSKLADFEISVAACLTASALNIGYAPVTKSGTAALERARLSHVMHNCLSAETFSAANPPLIDTQADLGFDREGTHGCSHPTNRCHASARSVRQGMRSTESPSR
ncbi:Tn3 family transposase [Microbispora rosea]|uniref:Tn3 family transposase n=1 Tax=Microbispora rosea TaxID=58117 RepID=UPI00341E24F4